MPVLSKGLGIIGMRERASLINATLEVRSAPGQGTVLTVEAPLHG